MEHADRVEIESGSRYTISYYVILHHVISYYIILYHMMNHYSFFILHHIISYYIGCRIQTWTATELRAIQHNHPIQGSHNGEFDGVIGCVDGTFIPIATP